jgi:hypothetical protein
MTAAAGPAVVLRNFGLKAWRRISAAHKPLVRLARRNARTGERREALREVADIERELARVASGHGPIIAGPWLAEVGYEALYWVPFLRWFQDAFRIPPERLIVISRGGVRDWYAGIASRYVEIFDLLTPEELQARNDARRHGAEGGGRKQTSRAGLDEEILSRVRSREGVAGEAVCHPSLMFRLFRHVWHDTLPFDYFWTHTRYARLAPPVTLPGLPPEFSVVKFYSGAALPPDDWTRRRLRALVAQEAAVRPVILLDSGVAVDEHEDYTFDDLPNVTSAREWMTPATNLAVQTMLIARARVFLGTCGGLAWLAPFLGTTTIAAYADDRQLVPHLYIARQAVQRARAAEFLPLDLRAERSIGR